MRSRTGRPNQAGVAYAVAPADLKALEQKIAAFEEAYIKPRQSTVAGAAATRELPGLFNKAFTILEERIDGMVFKFKSKSPEFFAEYTSARVVVDARTVSADKPADAANTTPATTATSSDKPKVA